MATMVGGGGPGRDAAPRARGRGEVFPGLEAFIGTGILVGLLTSLAAAGWRGRFDGQAFTLAGECVGLGAILGLFVGLGRGVWRPGRPTRAEAPGAGAPAAPPTALWDPWLDQGRDLDPAPPEVAIEEPSPPEPETPEPPAPDRAAVRPRVISPRTGETIRLEDEIGPMIEEGRGGLVTIVGGPGSGKTTALRHLAAVLPPWSRGRVRLLEDLDFTAMASAGPDALVILALDSSEVAKPGYENMISGCPPHELAALDHLLSSRKPCLYRLAPWDQDDAIEYLLATDRDACASVMGRLKRSGGLDLLDGIPELVATVLDRMARDESIADVRTALRDELAGRIEATSLQRVHVEDLCVDAFRNTANGELPAAIARLAGGDPAGVHLARLIRHRPATVLLAADRIAVLIERGCVTPALTHRFPRELVREVARQIAASETAITHLGRWIGDDAPDIHPLAASLLHAVTPGWRPDPECRPRLLEGAYLDGAIWPGVRLGEVDLRGADLQEADLREADLHRAHAARACLRRANLRGAVVRHWSAEGADLGWADLSRARGSHARFRDADLSGARLVEAHLWTADLTGARIEGADFTGAVLEDACLRGLPLRLARFDRARLGGADLRECDMEDMELREIDLHDADLRGAVLTGSRLPAANLRGARLCDAKLAGIDWPGACLRGADLRGVNFHLGTTRSGLVGSPIAGEGSRTGFYTHDDLDRHIRPAEEIRKANLRGADLRGALIGKVDFYLVDLRGARYTPRQAAHLRRCRAILDDGAA